MNEMSHGLLSPVTRSLAARVGELAGSGTVGGTAASCGGAGGGPPDGGGGGGGGCVIGTHAAAIAAKPATAAIRGTRPRLRCTASSASGHPLLSAPLVVVSARREYGFTQPMDCTSRNAGRAPVSSSHPPVMLTA